MTWEIAKKDHIGGRKEQQDSVASFSNGNIHLLIIADGMGGHKGGRLASKMVIETALLEWEKYEQGEAVTVPKKFLQHICEQAHYNFQELGKKYNLSPHSTCVLLYINDKQASWTHLGDSRLYHYRKKKLLQRTKDHSMVQLLVDLGQVKEENMATHPEQSHLLKGLGGNLPFKPDFAQTTVHSGDSFLLCSDGFWEHVLVPNMSNTLLQTDIPLKKRVQKLLQDALEAGGFEGDNIAIAVASCHEKKTVHIKTYFVLGFIIIALLTIIIWNY